MNGLFKPSILPMTDDYQKTMEIIAEKQKTEKKEPIVLKDPAKSYHPEGNKTNLPTITTTTPSSGGASLGVFWEKYFRFWNHKFRLRCNRRWWIWKQ